jgi:hypothetical protein
MDIIQKIEEYYKGSDKAKQDLINKRLSVENPSPPLSNAKLKKIIDKMFFNNKASEFGDYAEDIFGNNGDVAQLIRELEKLEKSGGKAKFGKKGGLGGLLADLKDFNKAGMAMVSIMDRMYYDKLQKTDIKFWNNLLSK